jgi:hypothetical protein
MTQAVDDSDCQCYGQLLLLVGVDLNVIQQNYFKLDVEKFLE